ncbi:MAG: hypothetical protein ACXABY_32675 [Candidatus Thorarchaeota archaeon]|jgi:hypothetical protein
MTGNQYVHFNKLKKAKQDLLSGLAKLLGEIEKSNGIAVDCCIQSPDLEESGSKRASDKSVVWRWDGQKMRYLKDKSIEVVDSDIQRGYSTGKNNYSFRTVMQSEKL